MLQLVDGHKQPMNSGPLQLFTTPHPAKLANHGVNQSTGVAEFDNLLLSNTSDLNFELSPYTKSSDKKPKQKKHNKVDLATPITVMESMEGFVNKISPTSQSSFRMASRKGLTGPIVSLKSWSDVLSGDMKALTYMWCHLWISRKLFFEADQTIDHTLVTCGKIIDQRYIFLPR